GNRGVHRVRSPVPPWTMRSDGPAPAHSMAIGVPSADLTVDVDVCAAPAAAMVAMHRSNTLSVRIDPPSLIGDCAPVYHALAVLPPIFYFPRDRNARRLPRPMRTGSRRPLQSPARLGGHLERGKTGVSVGPAASGCSTGRSSTNLVAWVRTASGARSLL